MAWRIAARSKTATSVTYPCHRIEMLPEQRLCLQRITWTDLETSRPHWVSGKLAIYLLGVSRVQRSAIFARIPIIASISQFSDKSDIVPDYPSRSPRLVGGASSGGAAPEILQCMRVNDDGF